VKYEITLNGHTYEIEVELSSPMGMAEFAAYQPAPPVAETAPAPTAPSVAPAAPVTVENGEVIDAPMPGTILKVNVNVGDTIKAGDVLAILEAMKMENEIMAPRDGKVTQVAVSKGTTVDTGAVLLVLA